jgi:hypothetical protein
VKRLLLGKLADESQRGPNVVNSQVIFALNFLKGHTASEASDDDRYRHSGAPNDGFPVANSSVDNDAVVRLHGDSNGTGLAQLVENGNF